jgi:CBS domain-containing protein
MAAFAGVKDFLRQAHLAPLLAADAKALQTLNKWSTAGTALTVLEGANVHSCPVLDEDAEYFGCLSCNDLLRSLAATLRAKDAAWAENLGAVDLAALGAEFCAQSVEKLQHSGDLWLLNADDASTLMDAVIESFRIQDHHVHHRLFVCSTAQPGRMIRSPSQKTTVVNVTPGSERAAASGLKVTHVVTTGDVIKVLWDNRSVFGPSLSSSVEALELDAGACLTVPAATPAIVAFGYMARDNKSALGLTDADGKLVAALASSDLRGLTAEEFPLLTMPASDFVAIRSGRAGVDKAAALAGMRPDAAAAAAAARAGVETVTTDATLETVLGTLVSKHLHRIFVVDADGKPVSIITPTDVLRLVTKP